MTELDGLRAELDQLDRQLMETAARRLEVVRRIGAAKIDSGAPIFDRARERRVFEKAQRLGATLGLDDTLSQALMSALVEASHRTQEEAVLHAAASETRRKIVIVGGRGQMGRRLGGAFEARGHVVTALDRGDDLASSEALLQAEIVMLAVPMALAAPMAAEVGPLLPKGAVLCDINSLKGEVCAAMDRAFPGEVLGLHPMFGPSVKSLRRQKVVVCEIRGGPVGTWLQAELGRMGMELIESDPDTHDHMMAVIQVLVHFSTLVMGESLRRTGFSVAESLRFTSPIYRLELAFCGRLFTQDPELYAEIEMANPYGATVRAHFREASEALEAAVQAGDREAFRELFAGVSAYFASFGTEAMALSDRIIESLVTHP